MGVNFKVKTINNGFIVEVQDAVKHGGIYVFKTTEELKLLEFLGQLLLEKRIAVTEK
jgi:hypothetical protein